MVAGQHNAEPTAFGVGRPERLRVLYVMPNTTRFAGVEGVVHDVCSELARRFGDRLDIHMLLTSEIDGLAVTDVPYRVVRRRAADRWHLLRIFRETIREGGYDLAVVPQVEATVLVALACLGLRPKLILYLHGNTDREQSHWKARVLFLLLRTAVLRRLAGVFGVSPTQLDAFRSQFGGSCPHVWVPNPVRRFAGAGRERQVTGEVVTFVNVARFAYQKGHDLLIAAFAALHAVRPRSRLVLVGYGLLEGEVRTAIEARGLGGVVSVEARLNDPEPVLAVGDVYVSTSRWEGWGLAICEALRFGLPVIAIDCPYGPSDILTDQRLGCLVAPGRQDELVDAMIRYCDTLPHERQHAAFRRDYVDQFSLERVVHRHAEALVSTAERGRRRRALAAADQAVH